MADRLVRQAINQTLAPIYERQFSRNSFGFRPKRGCHDALRMAQRIVNEGYKYVVDLDLERFFDTVNHSRLIEILSRTIKDGRVVSLIHKYLRSGIMNHGMFEMSKEAAMRTKESVTRFIEGKLHLKVNKEKTVVSSVRGLKYLGYAFLYLKVNANSVYIPKPKQS